MTGSADSGKCRMELRVSGGQGLVPAVVQWTAPSRGGLGRLLRANLAPLGALVIADCRGYR